MKETSFLAQWRLREKEVGHENTRGRPAIFALFIFQK